MAPERDDRHRRTGDVPDPIDEKSFLEIWRVVAIITCTGLIIFTVLIDSIGRLLFNPDFHVSEIIFGLLTTSWMVLLGFEAYARRFKDDGL